MGEYSTKEIRYAWETVGLLDSDLSLLLSTLGEIRADQTGCKRGEQAPRPDHCICWTSCEEPCCWCADDSEGVGEDGICPRLSGPSRDGAPG